ncbi:DsbA family protein [Chloroflexi bacterium TSY]|nr:DsbA family protein [Chloroflexi bacterium TSY]
MTSKRKATRPKQRQQRQRQKRNRRLVALAAIALFIGGLGFFTWQETANIRALPADSIPDPVLGSEGATIEIVEYGDFGCHACRAWHNSGIREQVLATFGEHVRFVWKDFPVITAQSPQAAEAGHCASAQGRFWEFHDYVYENFNHLSNENLLDYAAAIELDMELFQTCLDEGQMSLKVRTNLQEARRLGLRGTPGFAVNGRILGGPPNFDRLAQLISSEISN